MNYIENRLNPYIYEQEHKISHIRKTFKGITLAFFILELVALLIYVIGTIASPVYTAFSLFAGVVCAVGIILEFYGLLFYSPFKARKGEAFLAGMMEQINLFRYSAGAYKDENGEALFVETMEACIKEGY